MYVQSEAVREVRRKKLAHVLVSVLQNPIDEPIFPYCHSTTWEEPNILGTNCSAWAKSVPLTWDYVSAWNDKHWWIFSNIGRKISERCDIFTAFSSPFVHEIRNDWYMTDQSTWNYAIPDRKVVFHLFKKRKIVSETPRPWDTIIFGASV